MPILMHPFKVPINFKSLIPEESFFLNETCLYYSKPKIQNTGSRKAKKQTNVGRSHVEIIRGKRWVQFGYAGERAKVIHSRPGNSFSKGSVTPGLEYIPLDTKVLLSYTWANIFMLAAAICT